MLAELVGHLRAETWARYALVFIPLFAVVLRGAAASPPRRDGLLLVAAALAFELFCLAGNTTRLARPAFALAVVGLCRAFGHAEGRGALLAFWLVPVPWVVLKLVSPGLERLWLDASVALVHAFGGDLEVQRSVVQGAAGSLTLRASDSGLVAVALLSGIGWYAGLRLRDTLTLCARRALLWGAIGIPAQAVATLAAVVAVAAGQPAFGRSILDPLLWLLLAGLGITQAERLFRRDAKHIAALAPATEGRPAHV